MFPKRTEMKPRNFKKNYIETKGGKDLEEEEERRIKKKKDLKTIAMNNKSVLLMACPKCSIFM